MSGQGLEREPSVNDSTARPHVGCGRAGRELPLQQLLGQAALDIVPQCLPLIPILPAAPEKVPAKASDGTRYALWEKVRFFEPFRYGASCAEVHEVELKPFAYA